MSGESKLLILIGVLFLLVALFWKLQTRSHKGKLSPQLEEIKIWKKHNNQSGLEVALIETSSGWKILDEAEPQGNGVITVYQGFSPNSKPKKCYSIVRKQASMFNRRNYRFLKSDCLVKFENVKDDFKEDIAKTVSLSNTGKIQLETIMNYLKSINIIRN